jgi:hypothetical protein
MQISDLKVKGLYTLTNATDSKDRSWTHNVWQVLAVNDAHVEVREMKTDGTRNGWRLVLCFAEYNWHPADGFCAAEAA